MSEIYDYPKYYEIAFSWRSITSEVSLFEECFKRYSKIPVKSVLELGCGNSPHMEELVRRGYSYTGLDINNTMLEYSRQKAVKANIDAEFIQESMIDFNIDAEFEFVYTLLDSLFAINTKELFRHFKSVAGVLKKGGLYLLDWCVLFDPPWETRGETSWEMEQDGIRVKTMVEWKPICLARQSFEETITFEIDDNGKKLTLSGKDIRRAIYPQEFLRMIELIDEFEFVGWWNRWNLDEPLEKAIKIDRPIILLERV